MMALIHCVFWAKQDFGSPTRRGGADRKHDGKPPGMRLVEAPPSGQDDCYMWKQGENDVLFSGRHGNRSGATSKLC